MLAATQKVLAGIRALHTSVNTRAASKEEARAEWRLRELSGQLNELSGGASSAALTLAFHLVVEAQADEEPAVFVTSGTDIFYPPDVAQLGVDLDALAVVRVPDASAILRAADPLARSGAFGLIVLDLGERAELPMPLASRLLGLAQKHDITVLFLTEKPSSAPSLGSLISLRGHAALSRVSTSTATSLARFLCTLTVVKDKRRAPGWTHLKECHGPAGLR